MVPDKIPALPASWPQDGRARIRTTADGRTFAIHPEREKVELVAGKWSCPSGEVAA